MLYILQSPWSNHQYCLRFFTEDTKLCNFIFPYLLNSHHHMDQNSGKSFCICCHYTWYLFLLLSTHYLGNHRWCNKSDKHAFCYTITQSFQTGNNRWSTWWLKLEKVGRTGNGLVGRESAGACVQVSGALGSLTLWNDYYVLNEFWNW